MNNLNGNQKTKIYTVLCAGIILLLSSLYLFSPLSFSQVASAFNGNYSRTTQTTLTMNDWNLLDTDFLALEGGTMTGVLNMGGRDITGLPATPPGPTSAASKQYVDSITSSGGSIFINWGRDDCPTGITRLYGGFAFSNDPISAEPGAGSEPLCIKLPLTGSEGAAQPTFTGKLFSMGTSQSRSLPSGIAQLREVKCAVCYKPNAVCYENIGDATCPSGFSSAFSGWLLGGISNNNRTNQQNYHCFNSNFDTSVANNYSTATFYGATIQGDDDTPSFTRNAFIRCAMCCSN